MNNSTNYKANKQPKPLKCFKHLPHIEYAIISIQWKLNIFIIIFNQIKYKKKETIWFYIIISFLFSIYLVNNKENQKIFPQCIN